MPEKPMNAMAMKPAITKAIPGPSSPGGILALLSFCLIPAIAIMAMNHPIPLPSPKKKEVSRVYSLITMKRLTPRIAQLTVISGRNMPSD
jgi:hypothetical protein